MNRKLKKLIKNPRLYFVDMFKKKVANGSLSLRFLPMLKEKGNHKFSVVSAVYGVEKYLEKYFTSFENQTLNFTDHIELIMVDDGSPDGSANIIKKWVEKYPNNIKYIKKENGGQASARNLGIDHVSNDWVTFIDPDDFVSMNYFAEVDKCISKVKDIVAVSCNFIFYKEDIDQFSDTHPLKYRFKDAEKILDVSNMGQHVQLSASTGFYRIDIIRKHSLTMDPAIKPSFEDAHFVGRYLLLCKGSVAFIQSAKYYYRKRSDNSSTLDGVWQNPKFFTDKLEYGSLSLLKFAIGTQGHVPEYVQRTILYDYIWYIKGLVNKNERISTISDKEIERFLSLSYQIFEYIDVSVIDRFNLAGSWFQDKVGMLGFFKGLKPTFQIVYIDGFDSVNRLVKLRYFYHGSPPLEEFTLNDEEVLPEFIKPRLHDYVSKAFVVERIIWVPFDEAKRVFKVKIEGVNTRFSMAGKHYDQGISTDQVVNTFMKKVLNKDIPQHAIFLKKEAKDQHNASLYQNAWIFMDRDTQADDNAEHLYRYVAKNHPKINAFFVLRNTSNDWARLKEEGFRLLDFDSREHKLALLNAEHMISSHVDRYVISLLDNRWYKDMLRFRFTFLQHGIIKDDLSAWLNTKPIDFFVTSTQPEYDSIATGLNHYKFSSKEVRLTGLPRHDALLRLNSEIETEKLIVIMPTWRNGIVGGAVGEGADRDINDEFYASDYAKSWKSFLHSKELKELVTHNSYEVVFYPHMNIQPYLNWFETPDYIKTISQDSVKSIQDLFCRAAVMVTDYSSVAFDMAYLNKAIVYYQFDYDYVFGGGHTTSKGYFEYTRDGFGPVCETESEVFSALSTVLTNKTKPEKVYLDRIESTFVRRDGLCCERVYEVILGLNSYDGINQKDLIELEYATRAQDGQVWDLAIKRWKTIYSEQTSVAFALKSGLSLIQACRQGGHLGEARNWVSDLAEKWGELSNKDDKNKLNIEKAELLISSFTWEKLLRNWQLAYSAMASGNWQEALKFWELIPIEISEQVSINTVFYKMECHAHLDQWQNIDSEVLRLNDQKLSSTEEVLLEGWRYASCKKWEMASKVWKTIPDNVMNEHFYSALYLVSKASCHYPDIVQYLNKTEGIGAINSQFENAIVSREVSSVMFSDYHQEDLSVYTSAMPPEKLQKYIESLNYYGFVGAAESIRKTALKAYPNEKKLLMENCDSV